MNLRDHALSAAPAILAGESESTPERRQGGSSVR